MKDEFSKKSQETQEAVVTEVRIMKDQVLIATELALFVDKPDELKKLVEKVIKSKWPAVKKDAWAAAMRRVLEDWKAMKPTLWQKVGKALFGLLAGIISREAAGLVTDGVKALVSWLTESFGQ